MTIQAIADRDALRRIAEVLDGTEWNSDTAAQVAAIVRARGFEIRDVEGSEDDGDAESLTCPQCGPAEVLEGQYMSAHQEGTGRYDGWLCSKCGGYWTPEELDQTSAYRQAFIDTGRKATDRGRVWFEVHTDGSARQRREARADWSQPSKAARVLAEVRACLVVVAGQGRGLRAGTAARWARESMIGYRHRHQAKARDLLYHMRQARAAGVLRVRVPS